MPTNEKEYNGYLFDQLTILDDLQEVAEKRKCYGNIKINQQKA